MYMVDTCMQVVQGSKQMEGAGVQICRTVGTPMLRNLDPYLMLDELKLPAKQAFAGFPDHPHRGFETCSVSAALKSRAAIMAAWCWQHGSMAAWQHQKYTQCAVQ